MKTLLLTLFVLAGSLGLAAVAHDGAKPASTPFQPGSEHALLQKNVGTWDAVLVSHEPDGKEVRTKGKLITSAVAGFHTVDTYEGDMMGGKFLGHGVNGYCTIRKQYFTYWVDSMTSSPLTAYGDYDATKHELSLSGECFGMSGKLEPCRIVTTFVDDDHKTFAMFGAGPDGKEMQHLRIEYTRKR